MFKFVSAFEDAVADFYGSPYAIAVDCCTHAIELCMFATNAKNVGIPTHTYISSPFTMDKLRINWHWEDNKWKDYYWFGNTNIIDAAVYWKQKSYIAGSLMCLSFQHKKHLSLGRGGMILTDDSALASRLKRIRYDGRDLENSIPWSKQDISEIGFHYYMTPETASDGLSKIPNAISRKPTKDYSWQDYPYLPDFPVFASKKH